MSLEHLWAGWRSAYVRSAATDPPDGSCVFCEILRGAEPPDHPQVLWRDEHAAALLNLFPYTNGHVLVMPVRHVGDLEVLTVEEGASVWGALGAAVTAIKAAYQPDGLNVGANLGRAAGAGIPGHFHLHAMPRWSGDTNFMTTVAGARVVNEPLPETYEKLAAAWPRP